MANALLTLNRELKALVAENDRVAKMFCHIEQAVEFKNAEHVYAAFDYYQDVTNDLEEKIKAKNVEIAKAKTSNKKSDPYAGLRALGIVKG